MSSRNGKTLRIVIFMILFAGLALAAYLSLHALRGTKLGTVIGLEELSQTRDTYYCPMHPYYKSDKPGDCPICNMSLVKMDQPASPEGHAATSTAKPSGERKILYWVDAMNPAHRSDKPGKAPDGMDLVPVYADESPPNEGFPPGTVQISSRKQQLIGVRYGEVLNQPISKSIRTVGRIAYDETRIIRIQPKIEGWIEKVYVDFAGKLVKKNQPLISIYSPELVSTQQEFLISIRAKDTLKDSPVKEIASNALSLYESARERLRLWDISEGEIREIERRGVPTKTLTLYAPSDGFVLTRNAFEKQRITPDTELYTIADLSTVWVLAEVYEYEMPMIKLGQEATMTLSYFPGESFLGKVTYIYPQLDPATRTLKVRIDLRNPGFKLKPDMYADVCLKIDYGRQLSIPEQAVLDSGTEQIVFVAHEGGYLEPRKVQLGAKIDDRFIVLSGLESGEKIVTSGNFLVDSESQIKSALGAMGGAGHSDHTSGAAAVTQQEPAGKIEDHGPSVEQEEVTGGHD